MKAMSDSKTYIYRMTHYSNIEFILREGLHCCNCKPQDPEYTSIGYKTLITNRGKSVVSIDPGGVLNDYIPFYFHYKMPMLYNIWKKEVADYNGSQDEIIYLVSTVEQIVALDLPFVFTDRHAYVAYLNYYNQYAQLTNLNWNIIKDHNWHQTYSEQRKELKQAEFLVHRHLPVTGLLGIIAHNQEIANFVREALVSVNSEVKLIVKPGYYYS